MACQRPSAIEMGTMHFWHADPSTQDVEICGQRCAFGQKLFQFLFSFMIKGYV